MQCISIIATKNTTLIKKKKKFDSKCLNGTKNIHRVVKQHIPLLTVHSVVFVRNLGLSHIKLFSCFFFNKAWLTLHLPLPSPWSSSQKHVLSDALRADCMLRGVQTPWPPSLAPIRTSFSLFLDGGVVTALLSLIPPT